jgi:hypothetical protein
MQRRCMPASAACLLLHAAELLLHAAGLADRRPMLQSRQGHCFACSGALRTGNCVRVLFGSASLHAATCVRASKRGLSAGRDRARAFCWRASQMRTSASWVPVPRMTPSGWNSALAYPASTPASATCARARRHPTHLAQNPTHTAAPSRAAAPEHRTGMPRLHPQVTHLRTPNTRNLPRPHTVAAAPSLHSPAESRPPTSRARAGV